MLDLGFEPRIASEDFDSGKLRLPRIVQLISESRFGLHDLSRLKSAGADEFYRLNMPFELGLDLGCRLFGGNEENAKRILVVAEERTGYLAALSDMAGCDIKAHGNDARTLIGEVRSWLNDAELHTARGPAYFWNRFQDFDASNYEQLTRHGFDPSDIDNIGVPELLRRMRNWIAAHPAA